MRKPIVTTLAGSLVLLACSGGSGSTGNGSAAGADSFAQQYCDLYQPCCAKANKQYNQGQCVAVLIAAANGRTYDSAKGQECLTAARADAAKATFCDDGISDAADAICEKVLLGSGSGTKQPGDTCDVSSDCADSNEGEVTCITSFSNGATTKTCRLYAKARENEPCDATRSGRLTSGDTSKPRVAICDYDADGIFCDDGTCKKSGAAGAPCTFGSYVCVESAFCDMTQNNTCQPKREAGGDCTQSGDQCAPAFYCDEATSKCATKIASGQACTKSAQCANDSCTNGTCSSSSVTSSLICTN